MRKVVLIILFLPLVSAAQLTGRADDSLRKVSDTMHFPTPFAFKMTATTPLPAQKLYNVCYQWIKITADSLQEISIKKDNTHRKIRAGNIPATADISFSLLITVSGHAYSCYLQQYVYHTVNGARMPVEKAAITKDYRTTVNVERVVIMRTYPLIFNSLKNYIKTFK